MAKQKQQSGTAQNPQPKKRLSLGEFRAWLSGVEEMQSANWSPDANQWRVIRAKIDDVIDAIPQQAHIYEDDRPLRMAGPSAFAGPRPSSPMPLAGPPPNAGPASMPSGAVPPPMPGADGKIRTPNIDTSASPYVSSLE